MSTTGRLPRRFHTYRKIDGKVELLEAYEIGGYCPIDIDEIFEHRYKIIHKLGCGGFATVWLAHDGDGNRLVALKFLKACNSATREDVKGPRENRCPMIREVRTPIALGGLDELHTNERLASLIEKEDEKRLALTSEHFWYQSPNGRHLVMISPLNGPNLQDHLASKLIDAKSARQLSKQVAQGLKVMHRVGMAHGDLTTRNILFKLRNLDDLPEGDSFDCFGPIIRQKQHLVPSGSVPRYLYRDFNISDMDEQFLQLDQLTIIDFGLAYNFLNQESSKGSAPLPYCAPERMWLEDRQHFLGRFSSHQKRSGAGGDIWQLACVIFELRAGQQLFNTGADSNKGVMGEIKDTMVHEWNEYLDGWSCACKTCLERVACTTPALKLKVFGIGKEKSLRSRLQKRGKVPEISDKEAEQLYDLLKKMLRRSPFDRPQIAEVLKHPYLNTDFETVESGNEPVSTVGQGKTKRKFGLLSSDGEPEKTGNESISSIDKRTKAWSAILGKAGGIRSGPVF